MTGDLRERIRQTRSQINLARVKNQLRQFGSPYCEWCGNDFEPSYLSRPQRFCKPACHRAYHGRFSHRRTA